MQNYIVKAIRNFNDVVEKNEYGLDTPRTAEVSIWNCTKERYEFLKQNNAVVLMGIEEVKEEPNINIEIKTILDGKTLKENLITTQEALKDVIPADLEEKPKKTTKKKTSKK